MSKGGWRNQRSNAQPFSDRGYRCNHAPTFKDITVFSGSCFVVWHEVIGVPQRIPSVFIGIDGEVANVFP
jgi:hypothetical protein